ncbi:putative amine oxidase [copper-containing] [Physella acuta]|uniref:putative amine oxidase [copper-containing] n=1 Tax=Physella acuta TaxID=109671 RepID=UPI0027DCAB14|nr:putative amine oxidase [copper-containing] [Physella acuta]XP_059172020.1 putative amine oxidase [copper-containing] [Physella acuta]
MAKKIVGLLKMWFWGLVAMFFVVLSIGLAIALIVVCKQRDALQSGTTATTAASTNTTTKSTACGATNTNDNTINLMEPLTPGPFHDLTIQEIKNVRTYLLNEKIISSGTAALGSSSIYMMDLLLPNKAEVLSFLDNSGVPPNRAARVMVFRGDLTPPVVQEFRCGPLPNIFSCNLNNDSRSRNPVEFSIRPFSNLEYAAIKQNILTKIDNELGTILTESYNATFTKCTDSADCLNFGNMPINTYYLGDINKRSNWIVGFYNLPYAPLHPIGFAFELSVDGVDPKNWTVGKVWYNGALYQSIADFSSKYNTLTNKINMTKPVDNDKLYSSLQRRGDPQPINPQRAPVLVEPDGKRYSVKNRRVTYLNWAFNFRMSSFTGPMLNDIRFKGERIAYELGLSELAVFYSGATPSVQFSNFVDSGYLIGTQSKALVPGADCPDTATLVNQTFMSQSSDTPGVYDAAFCLFEHNNGFPLRRHLTYGNSRRAFYGGMLDSALILRSALTVFNYDYIVDFIFHQNGALETKIMPTGYIQSNYFSDIEKMYGFQLGDTLFGNLHHHLAHFKVDLDIGGTSNRYQTLNIVQDQTNRTDDPTKMLYQNKMVKTLKTTEKEALLDFNFEQPKYHVVYNNASKTSYSQHKSYRILIDSMSKSLLPEGQGTEKSIPWARHQLAVTKQKDTERGSSSSYANLDSANPVVNFAQFYEDDENIVDQDLVFWVTMGTYHIPHTEDLPTVSTTGNHLTFYLLPFNYFPECPSMSSRDAVYVRHTDPKDPKLGVTVDRNGNSVGQCMIAKPTLEDDVTKNPDQVLESRRVNLMN